MWGFWLTNKPARYGLRVLRCPTTAVGAQSFLRLHAPPNEEAWVIADVRPIDVACGCESMLAVEHLPFARDGNGIGKQIPPVAGLHLGRVFLHSVRPNVTVVARADEGAELGGARGEGQA